MGVLGHFRDSVTIVNRTIGGGEFERNLNVRYDGEDIVIRPGENHGFPRVAVEFAIRQNPLMGSKHPIDPRKFISLVGIVGSKKFPVDPIPEEVLKRASQALEVVDRDGDFSGEPMRKVRLLKKSGYSPYEAQADAGTGFDVNRNID